MGAIAPGIALLNLILPPWKNKCGRAYIFIFTFIIYTCYHLSRKPISVVKSVLHANCSEKAEKHGKHVLPNSTDCDWVPFDGQNYGSLLGTLDVVFLSTYALGVFFSGQLADRFHLRRYLAVGCSLCGITTIGFGLGYFLNIHHYSFYLMVQLFGGFAQATGWPAVVACMGNWFGKSRRGLFMGLWNAHASLGNILGSIIAGAFVDYAWGWSFIVPGIIIFACGILTFFLLLPYPEEVNLDPTERLVRKCDDVESTNEGEGSINSEDLGSGTIYTVHSSSDPVLIAPLKSISFLSAIRVPGVMEYSFSLFFGKLVSYTFLFWLPDYISKNGHFSPEVSAMLSTIFDVGGILGGILAGLISDHTSASATVCTVMLSASVPMLYVFHIYGFVSMTSCIACLVPLGLLINGPYGLITTAVSADLGTHPSLQADARALATVTGIIDGTGSIGAALGPFLCGVLQPYPWFSALPMLMLSVSLAALLLLRRTIQELRYCCQRRRPLDRIALITDNVQPII